MIDGTSAKQLNLSEITEVVSSSIATMGWKRYSAGESSKINYNYRFDLYIRSCFWVNNEQRRYLCLFSQAKFRY